MNMPNAKEKRRKALGKNISIPKKTECTMILIKIGKKRKIQDFITAKAGQEFVILDFNLQLIDLKSLDFSTF